MSTDVAPGWYPDPESAGRLRYWDGRAWTEHLQPAGEPTPGGSGPGGGFAAALEGAAAQGGHRRLAQLTEAGLFTSALPVDELALVEQAGFEPLGIVGGTSLHRIALKPSNPDESHELGALSQAMYSARAEAVAGMRAEAGELGADGVVGVRLEIGGYEWAPSMAELVATGTAVREHAGQPRREGTSFATHLDGRELATLVGAGYRPAGLAMGNCVYHLGYRGLAGYFGEAGEGVELDVYARALHEARSLAMERMQHEAARLGADGMVAVRTSETSRGWGPHVIEFFAMGTAVVRAPAPEA